MTEETDEMELGLGPNAVEKEQEQLRIRVALLEDRLENLIKQLNKGRSTKKV